MRSSRLGALAGLGALAVGCNVILGLGNKSVAVEDGGADALASDGPGEAGDSMLCGNGMLDPGEACDPSAPDGGSTPACVSLFGHGATGTTKCAACSLDDSACTLSQLQAGSPWPMYGRTLTHASRSSAHGPHTQPTAAAVQTIFASTSGAVQYGSLVIDSSGTVYQAMADYSGGGDPGLWVHPRGAGTVTRVTAGVATGDTGDCGLVGSLALAADGTVYGQTSSGWLYAYRRGADAGTFTATAVQVSSAAQDCSGGLVGGPAIDADGTVFVTFSDGLYSYVPGSGAIRHLSSCPAHYPPVIGADGVVAWEGYYSDAVVCSYSPATGTASTSGAFAAGSSASLTLGLDGRIILPLSYVPGGVYALSTPIAGKTGTQLMASAIVGLGLSVGADATLYAAALDGKLYALDPSAAASHNPRWSAELGGSLGSIPLVDADDYTYVIAVDGTLYATDPTGKLAWSTALAGGTANYNAAMDADGTLYVGTDDRVFAVSP